jgi:diacylglycerol kinase family enzyme
MAVHIFINPKSGQGRGRMLAEKLSRFRPIILEPKAVMNQISDAISFGDTVVIAGGDGTVSLIVGTLFHLGLGERVVGALLPLGTGNDLARDLGSTFPSNPVHFIESISRTLFAGREVTVWQMGRRYFINYVGIGLDGQILAMADPLRKALPARTLVAKTAFGLAGLRYLGYRIRRELRVKTDSGTVELRGKSGIILSNIGYYAGGCRVGTFNTSRPMLSVTVLRSSLDLARIFFSRFGGRQPVLDYTLTKEALIEGKAAPVQVDGEVASFEIGRIRSAGRMKFIVCSL